MNQRLIYIIDKNAQPLTNSKPNALLFLSFKAFGLNKIYGKTNIKRINSALGLLSGVNGQAALAWESLFNSITSIYILNLRAGFFVRLREYFSIQG
jgi:hypothetical protein